MASKDHDSNVVEQTVPLPAHPDEQDAMPDKVISSTVGDVLQTQGVTRMEAVYRDVQTNRLSFYLVAASVLVCASAFSLDSSTTSSYSVEASSAYQEHSSVLSTLSIATGIISAVAKPFIAKLSDTTSRPYMYLLALVFYVLGYIVVAASHTIAGYVVGEVFVAVGSSGLDLVNDTIVADMAPLEWRGFVGSMLSTPFIINTWFAGKIVDAMVSRGQWCWGYGMFAIIMSVGRKTRPSPASPQLLPFVWICAWCCSVDFFWSD
ncbi:hypothetical protein Plec18167_009186 [Paecilomyces lecythidis]|uniref:Major facilitator superfamily (MFS) profile domain-containing protein n=1 Tax=Paecilomyces lecythidis TaxID=3004212 RepID=A0ABR3WR03_9EURO